METARNPFPFGTGKAIARSVENPPRHRGTFFVPTMEPPEEAGRFVAEAGVEVVKLLSRGWTSRLLFQKTTKGPNGKRRRMKRAF